MSSQDDLKHALEEKFGLRNVRAAWIRRQTAFSTDVVAGPICRTDLSEITEGTLPWNIAEAHSVQLDTKVLVQIEDIVNIACADPRSATAPRVLQLTLTDGCTDFVAVELEPLQKISQMTVPGSKIILHSTALVRRGRVFLTGKDFTFLGSPSSNVWGDAYNEKVDSALVAAGLQNANASAFDSITRSQARNGEGIRAFPDMGGIADPIADAEIEDDEDFWAQVAEIADRNETGVVAREALHEGSVPIVINHTEQVDVSPRQIAVSPQLRSGAERDLSSSFREGNAATGPERHEPISLVISSDHSDDAMDIPEVPIFDSDAAAFDLDSDAATAAQQFGAPNSKEMGTDFDFFTVPALPLSRFEHISNTRDDGVRSSVYRAFAMKPLTKQKAVAYSEGFLVSTPFGDGTAVVNFSIDGSLLTRLTGIYLHLPESTQRLGNNDEDIRRSSKTSRHPHKYTRGIMGFIHVRHDENNTVTAVLTEPPGGYTSFLAAYADNVEARLARYFMEDAN